jgi:lipoic acid synthetase
MVYREPLPSWLKQKVPTGPNFHRIRKNLRNLNLHTVCNITTLLVLVT